MKNIVITIAFVFVSFISFSQNSVPIGSNQLNIGVGLSGWGVPVYIGIDHGFKSDLTLGGELSYRSYSENWNSDNYNQSIIGISGNLNYHFNRILELPAQWDFYAGANLGFFIWNSPDAYDGDNNSGLGLGGQIGTRYYLSNRLGLNLEFGGSNAFSGGKFGITIKM
jgi:hypothetical protein